MGKVFLGNRKYSKAHSMISKGEDTMSIVNIKDESQFEQEIMKSTDTVLVDFYADWCGPCKMVAPILEEMAREGIVQVAKVNVDQQPKLAERFGILSIPTMIVFQDGKEKKKLIGARSKQDLIDSISQ